MKYFIYCRISDASQSEQSLSIQEEVCRKHIGETTEPIIVVRDIGSGKDTEQRPNFLMMMNSLQQGDKIYVYDSSRISRDSQQALFFFNEIQQRGAELYCDGKLYSKKSPIDTMLYTIQSGFNQMQRELQNQKAQQGMDARKASGDWAVRGDLFGYHSYRSKGKVRAEIDPIASKYIQYIFEQYSTGRSSNSIGREMENVIVPGYEHYRFTPANVVRMINQTIYMGYMMPKRDKILKYSREQLESMLIKSNVYPAIVSPELWFKCFESHRTVHRSHTVQYEYRYSFYELSTIFRCPYCSATWTHHYSKGKEVHEKYRSLVHTCNKGNYRDFDKDAMEMIMRTALILTFLDHDEVECFFKTEREKAGIEKNELKKELEGIEKIIAQNKKKMAKLTDLAMDDLIDRDTLKERMGKLKEETTKQENSYFTLLDTIERQDALIDDWYAEMTRDVLEEYAQLEPSLRRDLLKKYISHSYVLKEGFEIEFLNGKRFTTDMWEKRKKKLTPLTMNVYFKGSEQYRLSLDFQKKCVSLIDPEEDTDGFFHKRNERISASLNRWLEKFSGFATRGVKKFC